MKAKIMKISIVMGLSYSARKYEGSAARIWRRREMTSAEENQSDGEANGEA